MYEKDRAIFTVIFIVILLVVLYYVIKRYKPKDEYKKSNGILDKHAMKTLNHILTKERTPVDNAIGALIIENNIIRADQTRPKPEMVNTVTNMYAEALINYNQDIWETDLPITHVIDNAQEWNEAVGGVPILNRAIQRGKAVHKEERTVLANKAKAAHGGAKGAFIDTFLEASKTYTDDPQNTHDPLVVNKVTAIADKLKKTYPSYKDIDGKAIVKTMSNINPKASEVINGVMAHPRLIDYTLKMTDADTIKLVWARIHDPANNAQRENLYAALASEMVDGTGACPTGIADHAFGSLAAIDQDKENWDIKTYESVRNALIEQSQILIKQHCHNVVKQNDDIHQVSAAKQFLAITPEELKSAGDSDTSTLTSELNTLVTELVQSNKDLNTDQKNNVIKYIADAVILS
jgi:hypothetical protein